MYALSHYKDPKVFEHLWMTGVMKLSWKPFQDKSEFVPLCFMWSLGLPHSIMEWNHTETLPKSLCNAFRFLSFQNNMCSRFLLFKNYLLCVLCHNNIECSKTQSMYGFAQICNLWWFWCMALEVNMTKTMLENYVGRKRMKTYSLRDSHHHISIWLCWIVMLENVEWEPARAQVICRRSLSCRWILYWQLSQLRLRLIFMQT